MRGAIHEPHGSALAREAYNAVNAVEVQHIDRKTLSSSSLNFGSIAHETDGKFTRS